MECTGDTLKEEELLGKLESIRLSLKETRVIVCVSGGPDSMALLHFFWSIKKEKSIKVWAAHLNHMLRNEASNRDEKFVYDWCRKKGIVLKLKRVNVKERADQLKCSLEECGRKIRYEFFESLAEELDAKIATAHTLSDSIETFFLNFLRGTGLHGLCGIPEKRDKIFRPFLPLSKKDVETYCKFFNVPYIIDDTNYSQEYTRNKIRHRVMPILNEINPSLEKVFARNISNLKQDDNYLQHLAQQALQEAKIGEGFSCRILACLPRPVFARVVILAAKSLFGVDLEEVHIKELFHLINKGHGRVTLPQKHELVVQRDILKAFLPKTLKPEWEVPFWGTKTLTEPGRKVIIKTIDYIPEQALLASNFLDAAKIGEQAVFRYRHKGDMFSPVGRNLTKTLKKFFNEKKVTPEERDSRIVLAQGSQILWVEGFGISQHVKVDTKTITAYELTVCV